MTLSGLQPGCIISWHFEKVASCRNLSHLNIYNQRSLYIFKDLFLDIYTEKYLYMCNIVPENQRICAAKSKHQRFCDLDAF